MGSGDDRDGAPTLFLANLAWQLGTGVGEIHVYFDDPEDPAIDRVRALDQVRVILCDEAH